MALLTYTQASKKFAYRSRSTLYKLKRDGLLDDYLCEVKGKDQHLLNSIGKPKLKDYLGLILQ
ncbi:hypothetical protein [Prochlorococcus sp. MIT 0801]|uniref:hypothetical protein n=1 Tax=Prochlorococcus sp. MIT 0801 TaxID=1501269 RepID=UPI0004F82C55|nr:hypothetical protein [Prochlorococcus sp. MIT 0801]AIQ97417.1 hypothetical protein EW15_1325 [Prochlorococcus sp. MIT 0801]